MARGELDLEATHINEQGELDPTIRDPRNAANDAQADALLLDIGQISFLLHSLSWAQLASQDTRVMAYIDKCLEAIHPNIASNTPSDYGTQIQLLAGWCILLSPSQPYQPLRAKFLTPSDGDAPSGTYNWPLSVLRKALGIRAHRTISVDFPRGLLSYVIFPGEHFSLLDFTVYFQSDTWCTGFVTSMHGTCMVVLYTVTIIPPGTSTDTLRVKYPLWHRRDRHGLPPRRSEGSSGRPRRRPCRI